MNTNKNLLENVDYVEGESQSVTSFLEIDCNKCGNKIKFKLGIGDIKNVEEYIEQLQEELEKKDKIIDEMASFIASQDIEDSICEKTGRLDECDSMACGECENCIKEYFKKKVEEK